MKTVGEIRLDNLERLIAHHGGVAAMIRSARGDHNLSPQYISQLRSRTATKSGTPRGMGDEFARTLERLYGLEVGAMDLPEVYIDPLERQLVTLYRELSEDRRYKLLLRANELHTDQHPGASAANPYPKAAAVFSDGGS